MTETQQTDTQTEVTQARPSWLTRFGRFLGRLLLAFLQIVVFFGILAALGAAGYFGYRELTRSFDSVHARIDANAERAATLQAELQGLDETSREQGQALVLLQSSSDSFSARLERLDENLTADFARQDELLTLLETQLEEASDQMSGQADMLVSVQTNFSALQSDLNRVGGDIDGLGGQLDQLQTDVTAVSTQVDGFERNVNQLETNIGGLSTQVLTLQETKATTPTLAFGSEGENGSLIRVLSLFRTWELVGRARLRLLENNFGLAQADVAAALANVALLLTVSEGETAVMLTQVQQRLTLANASLPADAATASRDLDNAWNELDLILTKLLMVAGPTEAATATPANEETQGDATPTPAADAPTPTPEADVATPTPTPEPSP